MKKLILALTALACMSPAFASPFDAVFRDDATEVIFSTSGITTNTSVILVSLADTVNWPHKKTGSIDVSGILVDIDKVGASTSTIKLGVVSMVDASSGTIRWFYVAGNTANHLSTPGPTSPFLAGLIRTKVVNHTTPYFLTNNVSTRSTLYQTDVALPTANGGPWVFPAVGDIVAYIEGGGASAALATTIHLTYSSER